MTNETTDGTARTWDMSELEDNIPNVNYDNDCLQVSCPSCGIFGGVNIQYIVDDGVSECIGCGAEFGLRLVDRSLRSDT